MGEVRRIPVRKEDVWTFTERNVSLWDLLEFFPPDAIGPRGPGDAPRPYEVKPITIDTDLGFSFETDIQYGTWMFRPRSPRQPGMMKWCRERGIEEGDALVFENIGERRYRLWLEKGGPRTGLTAAIDESLRLLQVHQPYHESDHVLNIAYNILCGGKTLEDLEQRRQDEVYLDALGAKVIPDPTTAGDFCRRFSAGDVETLLAAFDKVRMKVWLQQPVEFFAEAILE